MSLPKEYAWLEHEPGPKMLLEALKLYGVTEAQGNKDNPEILAWAKEVGVVGYNHDSIPWCGLLACLVAKRAGKEPPKDPLWALNWRKFGHPVTTAMLGDVLVFTRQGGGHVCLYVGEDDSCYHCLGGNESDKVCIERFPKSRHPDIRRPPYSVQPANVRVVHLAPVGTLSTKED